MKIIGFQKRINKNFKINIFLNAVYQVLLFIVPLITSPYISTVLSPQAIGSYSYAYSIITYFGLMAGFGFSIYGVTAIAQKRNNWQEKREQFWNLFYSKGLLGTIVSVLYFALCFFDTFLSQEFPFNTKAIFLIFGLEVVANIFDVTYLLQGEERFTTLCIRNILIKIISTICIFVFVKSDSDYFIYVLIMALSVFMTYFLIAFSIPKSAGKPIKLSKQIFVCYKEALPYFIPFLSTSIFPVITKTFLGGIINDSALSGFYEQADKIVTIVVTLIGSLNTIMMSRFSFLFANKNKNEIVSKTNKTLALYCLLSFPCFAGLIAINDIFTLGFFGTNYQLSVFLIYVLSLKIFFTPLSGIVGAIYYVPAGKLKARNIYLIITFIFTILIHFVLINYLSILGAAIASILTELLLTFLYIIGSSKHLDYSIIKPEGIKCFDAALIMLGFLFLIKSPIQNLSNKIFVLIGIQSSRAVLLGSAALLILIGIIVYGFLVLIFKEKIVSEIYQNLIIKFNRKLNRRKNEN